MRLLRKARAGRDPDAPRLTLRQRASLLKASAARVLRRSRPSDEASGPEPTDERAPAPASIVGEVRPGHAFVEGEVGRRGAASSRSGAAAGDEDLAALFAEVQAAEVRFSAAAKVEDLAEDQRRRGEISALALARAKARLDAASRRTDVLREQVIAARARTLHGLVLKARVATELDAYEVDVGGGTQDLPRRIVASLVRDLLAIGDSDEPKARATGEDAVLAAIEAHRAARAVLCDASSATDEVELGRAGGAISGEAMAAADAAWDAACAAEGEAWTALVSLRPASGTALARWLRYIADSPALGDIGRPHDLLQHIAEAAETVARTACASPVAEAAGAPDPIFAAIAASRAAEVAMQAFGERDPSLAGGRLASEELDEERRLAEERTRAREAVCAAVPTTLAGRLALLAFLRWQLALHAYPDGSIDGEDTMFADAYRALDRAVRAMAGTQSQASAVPDEPDPILALIDEHRAAYAERTKASATWNAMPSDAVGYAAAKAAAEEPSLREVEAFTALLASRPTSAAGLWALAVYLPEAVRQVSLEPDGEAERALIVLRDGALHLGLARAVAETSEASGLPDAPRAARPAEPSTSPLLDVQALTVEQLAGLYEVFARAKDTYQLATFWSWLGTECSAAIRVI